MSKKTIWMMAAALLIVVGCLILGYAVAKTEGDFMNMSVSEYETHDFEIDGDYHDILVKTNIADVDFVLSDDGVTRVTCFEESKMKHSVTVNDGKLVIEVVDTRKWYDHIKIFDFKTPKITVSLPSGTYGALSVETRTGDIHTSETLLFDKIDICLSTGDVKCRSSCRGSLMIETTTGDIELNDISAETVAISVSTGKLNASRVDCERDVSIKVSTGDTYLKDVTCAGVMSKGSTGDLVMKNVIASEKFSLSRTAGDIHFERCDAGEITVSVTTGDVKGTLLSEKNFIAKSNTGKVRVPEAEDGGKCKVTATTGNIEIKIED